MRKIIATLVLCTLLTGCTLASNSNIGKKIVGYALYIQNAEDAIDLNPQIGDSNLHIIIMGYDDVFENEMIQRTNSIAVRNANYHVNDIGNIYQFDSDFLLNEEEYRVSMYQIVIDSEKNISLEKITASVLVPADSSDVSLQYKTMNREYIEKTDNYDININFVHVQELTSLKIYDFKNSTLIATEVVSGNTYNLKGDFLIIEEIHTNVEGISTITKTAYTVSEIKMGYENTLSYNYQTLVPNELPIVKTLVLSLDD